MVVTQVNTKRNDPWNKQSCYKAKNAFNTTSLLFATCCYQDTSSNRGKEYMQPSVFKLIICQVIHVHLQMNSFKKQQTALTSMVIITFGSLFHRIANPQNHHMHYQNHLWIQYLKTAPHTQDMTLSSVINVRMILRKNANMENHLQCK